MRIILITLLILLMVRSISAETLDSEILKFEYHRFYFSNGTEALIIPGSKFEIFENDSSVYSGKIEKSFEGIAISYPVDTALQFDLVTLTGLLHTAEFDTTNPITIGYYDQALTVLLDRPIYNNVLYSTDSVTIPKIIWKKLYNNIEDLDSIPDALVSLAPIKNLGKYATTYTTLSSPLSLLAIVMPNLSKEINRNGLLTTSLYYRYNDDLLAHFYKGEIIPADCLFPSDTPCIRSYKYNHDKGRKLSSPLAAKYPELTINYNNLLLQETAEYFADILARDRFYVNVELRDQDADLVVFFVPYQKDNPALSFESILLYWKSTPALTPQQKENIDIITNRIKSAKETNDPQLKEYYWQLIDYSLKYDFGVFPLYQIKTYFYYNNSLYNAHYDENGFVDLGQLKKIKIDGEQ